MKVKSILETFWGTVVILFVLFMFVLSSALRTNSSVKQTSEPNDESESHLLAGPNTPRCDCI